MLHYIYSCSTAVILFLTAVLLAAWGYLCVKICKPRWQCVNLLLTIAAVAAILYTTLMTREPGLSLVILTPFAAFAAAQQQPELYREMLMNVFLFFPLGLTLSNALPQRLSRWVRIGITTLFACLLSTVIEYTQYHFSLGMAETDDVICNTLGAFIGSTSLMIAHAIENIRKGHGTP